MHHVIYNGPYYKKAAPTDPSNNPSGGMTWTTITDSPFGNTGFNGINGIAWGGDKFVAVGGDGKMAYSTDGVNWTKTEPPRDAFENLYGVNGIAWGNGKFVAVGNDGRMVYCAEN
jgi:hypothetical protein